MLEFELKRKNHKRLYSNLTLIVFLIVFIFLAHGTFKIFQKQMIVSQTLNNSKENFEEHQFKKNLLEEELSRLNTKVGQEEILRDNYFVAKEGERAVFILDSEDLEPEVQTNDNFLKKIENFIFELFN